MKLLMRFNCKSVWKNSLYTLKLIFNCHGKPVLWLFVLRSFLFRSVQFQKLFPIRSWAGPLTCGFEHVTLATRSEVSTGKVKRTRPNILKGNEISPLIVISSRDSHANNHSTRSSTKMNITFKWNTNPRLRSYPRQRFGYGENTGNK